MTAMTTINGTKSGVTLALDILSIIVRFTALCERRVTNCKQ